MEEEGKERDKEGEIDERREMEGETRNGAWRKKD